MKFYFTAILCLFIIPGYSQVLKDIEFDLNPTTYDDAYDHYMAQKQIILSNGFHFSATSSESFQGEINPAMVFAPSEDDGYKETGGPILMSGDESSIVAKLPGTIDISNNGAAIYTIPIECPEGINGMKPAIGLVYNSQNKNDVCGWGWGISGLSMIQRIPKNSYYDGQNEDINWDINDKFVLDGQQLVGFPDVDSDSNTKEYVIKGNYKILIVAHDLTSRGPDWFEVITPDGLKHEYKSERNIAVDLPEISGTPAKKVLSWYLSKTIDQYGNYIEYQYIQEEGYDPTLTYFSKSDFRITSISVNNKNGLKLVGVDFSYEDRPDKWFTYIDKGECSGLTKRLSEITVTLKEYSLSKYIINYLDEYDENYPSTEYTKVSNVKLTTGDDKLISTTKINWIENEYSNPVEKNMTFYESPIFNAYPEYDDLKNFYQNYGDFNGDGLTDILVVVEMEREWVTGVWPFKVTDRASKFARVLYLNNGTGSYYYKNEVELDKMTRFIILDKDHDGQSELYEISASESPGGLAYMGLLCYKYNVQTGVFVRYSLWDQITSLDDIADQSSLNLIPADFDGNKSIDFILLNGSNNFYGIKGVTVNSQTSFESPRAVYIADFNGNGKSDLIFHKNSGEITVWEYEYNGVQNKFVKIFTKSNIPFDKRVFFGDFNGDGKSDLMYYADTSDEWKIEVSTGLTWKESQIEVPTTLSHDPLNEPSHLHYFIHDFNGDGKSDILEFALIWNNGASSSHYRRLYISNGTSFQMVINQYVSAGAENIRSLGQFDNSPEFDLIIGVRNSTSYLTFNKGFQYNHVNKITDKFNTDIEIEFANNQYPNSKNSSWLDREFDAWNVVPTAMQLLQVNSISDGLVKTTKTFQNPQIHEKVGFLGFENIITTSKILPNGQNNIVEVHNSAYENFEKRLITFTPAQITKKVNATKVSQTDTNYKNKNSIISGQSFTSRVPDNSIVTDFINSGIKTKTQYYYDDFLNVTEQINEVFQNENVQSSTTIVSNYNPTTDPWRPSHLTSKIKMLHRPGEKYVLNQETYSYLTNGRISSINADKKVFDNAPDPVIIPQGEVSRFASVSDYEYDSFGNLSKKTDRVINDDDNILALNRNRHIEYHFTEDGFLLDYQQSHLGNDFRTSFIYDPITLINTSKQLPNNLEEISEYDSYGRLYKVINPDNTEKISKVYWVTNTQRSTWVSDLPNALYFKYVEMSGSMPIYAFYDKYGRELRSVSFGLNKKAKYVDKEYNNEGRLWKQSLPYFDGEEKYYVITTYDNYGRVQQTDNPDGTYVRFEYDGLKTTTYTRGKSGVEHFSIKTLNTTGEVAESEDELGNKVVYDYYSDGNLKASWINGKETSTKTEFTYDINGNRTEIKDPSAGTTTSLYNAWNQLIYTLDPLDNKTEYEYDIAGRVSKETITQNYGSQTALSYETNYEYDTEWKGAMHKLTGPNNYMEEYTFDSYGRTTQYKETIIDGSETLTNTHKTTYDGLGRLNTQTQVEAGITERFAYEEETGVLLQQFVKADDTEFKVFEAEEANSLGDLTGYSIGNNLAYHFIDKDLNSGQLNSIQLYSTDPTEGFNFTFDYEYFDDKNIKSRAYSLNGSTITNTNLNIGFTEYFEYDDLSRLTYFGSQDPTNGIADVDKTKYDLLGQKLNIPGVSNATTDESVYNTTSSSIYAVDEVKASKSMRHFWQPEQNIEYNRFRKVSHVDISGIGQPEDLDISYRPGGERYKTRYTLNGTAQTDKLYFGNYEVEKNLINGTQREVYFINGPSGMLGVVVREDGQTAEVFYTLCDHLGSIWAVVDNAGKIVENHNYDPWGRFRSYNVYNNTFTYLERDEQPVLFTGRGFTGHEHLTQFSLINMNGRVYDPVLGQFISPDPYVQAPDLPQNYNRYAYCFNNPLVYVDPSGEIAWFVPIIIGAAVFGTGNLAAHAIKGDVNSFGDGLKYFGQGALAGAALGAAWQFAPLIPGIGQGIQTGMTVYGKVHMWGTVASAGSGLLQGAFTGDWSALGNAGEIFLGNFYLDENKGVLGGAWEGISRHTWEFAQTGLGHSFAQLRNSFGAVDEVMYTDGITIALNYEAWSGSKYSLGNFINFGTDDTKEEFAIYDNLDLLHEMGHSHQSKRLGPLYLGIVIASPISAMFSTQIEGEPYGVRTHGMTSYERWANKLAKKYYEKYYSTWDETYYPIKKR